MVNRVFWLISDILYSCSSIFRRRDNDGSHVAFQYAEKGEVYTWGWRECLPSGKVICDLGSLQTETIGKESSMLTEQGHYLISKFFLALAACHFWKRSWNAFICSRPI